ncbi:unnamed protein product [Cylindrotheca closterium]|uniref:tRNA (guanine(37)-N1)-methyltransferase n=1 Tax=Cylindrotheca closterium TaxID=2856 RepID=A0AAD2JHS7_9STRA|nr:unnamed protein product [Cylindrotheca closterium]
MNQSSSLIADSIRTQKTSLLPSPANPEYIYPVELFPAAKEFDVSLIVPAIVVPSKLVSEYRKQLKEFVLDKAKLKVIVPLGDDDIIPVGLERRKHRKILLTKRSNIFDEEKIAKLLRNEGCFKANHELSQSYEDWSTHEVLSRLLPFPPNDVPSSFEQIGRLAHLNLRDDLLPFKYMIGKVILDKNSPRIQTVVNKLASIESKYRTFNMEVIAGNKADGWSLVSVKEEGCQFEMDFTKVYWNSRLGGEHRRLTQIIADQAKDADSPVIVADLMAGIGPFAIPLTSKGHKIEVHANDLNPESYNYLLSNSRKNRCTRLLCYNMDARDFCKYLQDSGIVFSHVIMNLPATAPEFLDAFRGFRGVRLPRIHVHCFAPKDHNEAAKDAVKRCESALGCTLDIDENQVKVIDVRNVSPKKNMYCISFDLPEAIRSVQSDRRRQSSHVEAKRQKLT